MGTRNLTCVILNGEYKVAQYCQWDGYLDGLGKDIADFLDKNKNNLDTFKKAVNNCSFISDEEIQKLWQSVGADDSGLVGMDISDAFKKKFPNLHRDTSGSDLFNNIIKHNGGLLSSALEFAGDSVFCQWGYVIDLDTNTFEIYRGHNEEELGEDERFHFLKQNKEPQEISVRKIKFYPIKLLTAFPLDMVTAEDIINFSKSMHDDPNSVDFMRNIDA